MYDLMVCQRDIWELFDGVGIGLLFGKGVLMVGRVYM